MKTTVTMDDAHAFAQGLIAEGWLNDDPNCVDTLHRRLEAFAAKCSAIASMQTTTAFSCPECCAKPGQRHEPTCPTLQAPAGPAIGSWHTGLPLPYPEAEPAAPAAQAVLNTITATLDDDNVAEQLAQFCKRSTFQTFYDYTEAHLSDEERKTRAYQMIRGIERVQQALAAAGYSPR